MIYRLLPSCRRYTLNIGLHPRCRSDHAPLMYPAEIYDKAMRWVRTNMPRADVVVVHNDDEPTMVVSGFLGSWPWTPKSDVARLFALAVAVCQDAVAVTTDSDAFLVGPGARAWGKFDSSRFITYTDAAFQRATENLLHYSEIHMNTKPTFAQMPRNCLRQRMEGRTPQVGPVSAPNLSAATVDKATADVVRDAPSKSYKPAHGGYPGQVR